MTAATMTSKTDYRKVARGIDDGATSFFTVRDWMCGPLGLRGAYLTVFAAVWGISSYGEDDAFLGGIQAIKGICGVSESTAKRAVRTLREAGLIVQGEWRDADGRARLSLAPDYEAVVSLLGVRGRKRPPRPAGSEVAKPVSSRVASVDIQGVRQPSGNDLSDENLTTCGASSANDTQHAQGVQKLGIRIYGNTDVRAGGQNEPRTPSKMNPVHIVELTDGINQRTQQRAGGDSTEASAEPRLSSSHQAPPRPSWERRRVMSAGDPASRAGSRPSVEEVAAYAERNGIEVDARAFVAENEARGWVDSRGRAVRSWRSWLKSWAAAEAAASIPVARRHRRGRRPRVVPPDKVARIAAFAEWNAEINTVEEAHDRAEAKVERRREERRRKYGPLPSTPPEIARRICELARNKRYDEAKALAAELKPSKGKGADVDE